MTGSETPDNPICSVTCVKLAGLFAICIWSSPLCAAEPSLVPDTPSTVPDYFCTWNVQGYACSYSNALRQADQMTEANLFGTGSHRNWISFHPKVRADLTFLLDDAFDFPVGVERNHPLRGSIELHPSRFPSYAGTPAERLAKLNRDVKARGWRDLGLWICNSRPNVEELPISSDSYWTERLKWSQEAGVRNWKVDWGIGFPNKPLWKFRVTPEGRRVAPDVWIEFGKQGDLYRTYDVHVYNSIPETIRRIAAFLQDGDAADRRIINCEDEVYIGAATASSYGVMRHPLAGAMPDGKPDAFFVAEFRDVKRRMDEVVRAVRWHRLAQPIPKGGEILVDANLLTDFKSKPATARLTRGGLPLPEVYVPQGEDLPYVLAARHLDGEVAVATVPRNIGVDGRRTLRYPLADVTLDIGAFDRPVGVFGRYRSLTLVCRDDLAGKRILAQDLAGDTPVDITAEVEVRGRVIEEHRLVISPRLKDMGEGATGLGYVPGSRVLEEGRLVIPGAVIDRVGLMAATPGDVSDPGLVLVVRDLTVIPPKKPMKPGMFGFPSPPMSKP